MKIKIIDVIHCPNSNLESHSKTFQVLDKNAVIYDGFEHGPFLSSNRKVKEWIRLAFFRAMKLDENKDI